MSINKTRQAGENIFVNLINVIGVATKVIVIMCACLLSNHAFSFFVKYLSWKLGTRLDKD